MSDDFERKIHAAGAAGWWTVLVGAVACDSMGGVPRHHVLTACVRALAMGASDGWRLQQLWLAATVFLKVFLAILALVCLWLTLWARQLRQAK